MRVFAEGGHGATIQAENEGEELLLIILFHQIEKSELADSSVSVKATLAKNTQEKFSSLLLMERGQG